MNKNPFLPYAEQVESTIHPTASLTENVKVTIKGNGHKVIIEEGVILRNAIITMSGKNGFLHIGKNCNLRGSFHVRHINSKIIIGENTTSVSVQLFGLEGKSILIGNDCMFSSGIISRTSDEHSIIDLESNMRINQPKDVIIGNHVWVGEGSTLNKGTVIPDNCIIGSASFVSRKLTRQSSIYAGSPAKIIREGITWKRELL